MKNTDRFISVSVEGAVLPSDLLRRIAAGDPNVEGLRPKDYFLPPGERINEAVSRAWNYLLGRWRSFKDKRAALGVDESGRGMTREYWLLPLFKELGYGRLQTIKGFTVEKKDYSISHARGNSPIHLMGCGVSLDRRKKGEPGASAANPHSLVQEFLNRSDDHLWGFVSNGLKLRLLRDNASLTRQAYVEFDLEVMMDGEVYSDFLLLWLLCHVSRVEGEPPEECYLEKWHQLARTSGVRILDNLRNGVEQAITALGQGMLSYRGNAALLEKLHTGQLSTMDFYRQLLRLVYRLIFLLVAESRGLLLLPDTDPDVKDRYERFYSISRLRELAEHRRSGSHGDLWQGVKLVFGLLGQDEGYPPLGLPGLGSFLWSAEATTDITDCRVANRDLLKAIYHLSFVIDNRVRQRVDYKNLGPEELGSVYEALLELHPDVNTTEARFELKRAEGSERKTTGSYYTPTSLIVSLLDTALDPLIKERQTEKELLALKVCDPACGSGHFLLAAAHRIARRLAAIRTGEPEPAPADIHSAVRDVIGHCIYGVDINPMSVELCKVSLWMEALEPGKPLSFLDHRILCGNSLMGAYPALLEKGIPDEVFKPIEGDDKEVCKKYKKLNKQESGSMSPRSLFDAAGEVWFGHKDISKEFINLDEIDDSTMEGIHLKEDAYRRMQQSVNYRYNKLIADAWCAAFVWKKQETEALPYPIHEEVFQSVRKNPDALPAWLAGEIDRLSEQYRFLHFHLAFPDVFRLQKNNEQPENPHTGWNGGFDVVLGNPPWERVKLQEKEWFASRNPTIANIANADVRRKMIADLHKDDPSLYDAFLKDRRQALGESQFVRNSGKFPLCGRGDVNTYMVFTETNRELISSTGRVGCIVPTGIATDDTTKFFFQDLMSTRTLDSLYDFENKTEYFPEVHSSQKFCLLTITGRDTSNDQEAEFFFFASNTSELRETKRRFNLTAEDIVLVNPNTRTCPVFRFKRDADLVKDIYKKIPILVGEEKEEGNSWNIKFITMFHMTNDSHLFKTRERLEIDGWHLEYNIFHKGKDTHLPLYEAKMMQFWDHRAADITRSEKALTRKSQPSQISLEDHKKPDRFAYPIYWVSDEDVALVVSKIEYPYRWFLGFTDVTSVTNERTFIPCIIPFSAVANTMPLIIGQPRSTDFFIIVANLSCFVFDYIARQKVGGIHVNYFILKQLPVLPPGIYDGPLSWERGNTLFDWMKPRILELTYTALDLKAFARDIGYDGPPFVWNVERRFLLRCELDAAYFHLYGIGENDVDYIMDTFPIVKRKDTAKYGTYRTKDKILEIYRQMAQAIQTGSSYQSQLDPPPADERAAHKVEPKELMISIEKKQEGNDG
jgi:hypothetical protein